MARVSSGWNVTVNYTWTQSASGPASSSLLGTESASARHVGNVIANLNTTENPTSGNWKGRVSGLAELYDRTAYQYEDPHYWSEMRGSGAPLTVIAPRPVEAWIAFNEAQCTYSLWVPTWLNMRHTDPDSAFTFDAVATNFWVAMLPIKYRRRRTIL